MTADALSAQDRVLVAARAAFAEHGFHGTRLQDVAAAAGLRHPTLLYHFGSKEGLYAAVIDDAFADWAAETERAISTGLRGFEQVAALIDAGSRFLTAHADFVRIWRHEALAGGGRLEDAMVAFIRPFVQRAIGFLHAEVAAGRLREHDPAELLHLGYATLMTHVSEERFRARLLDEDPSAAPDLMRHRAALTELLRGALEPPAARR
jgi:TetR/AcrR family transcriptional regulator